MPLLASLRTGLAALCRKFIICIRLPDYAYYINGPETLPPPLSKEEEKVVFAGLEAGNPDCRDVLIVHNLRLVVYIAKKFESKTASVEDMISIGTIGLIKAVNTFVPSKNIKLATYASRCIENEILMYLRKSSNKRQESSIDEPLNTDCDGNELLLSDVLGTDGNQVGADLEQAAEKKYAAGGGGPPFRTGEADHGAALRPFGRGGAYAEGSGGYDRHFPKLHFKAGKAHHQTAERRFGTHFLNRTNVKRRAG